MHIKGEGMQQYPQQQPYYQPPPVPKPKNIMMKRLAIIVFILFTASILIGAATPPATAHVLATVSAVIYILGFIFLCCI